MKLCPNCGAALSEEQSFCTQCGTTVEAFAEETTATEQQNTTASSVETLPKTAGMNTKMLIWSIVNLVISGANISTILAAIALTLTIIGGMQTEALAAQYNKYAKTLNLISTIVTVISYVAVALFFVFYFFIIMMGAMGALSF
ncbi:MAG: zinc-ribbon domain-containing protein [Clostridia bacterium]|nr:zinc-ribbon domain-containing protein [Clostridia bacterium]